MSMLLQKRHMYTLSLRTTALRYKQCNHPAWKWEEKAIRICL